MTRPSKRFERGTCPLTGKATIFDHQGKTPESFWTYKAPAPPTLAEAIAVDAIKANTTQIEWDKLSPGMKREIVRFAKNRRLMESVTKEHE